MGKVTPDGYPPLPGFRSAPSRKVGGENAKWKVAGVVAGCNPKKKAEAIDAEATRRADVVQRHRDEWDEHKGIVDTAIGTKDFETAKLAKITAETLKIRQEAERKAWAIDTQVAPVTNITVSQIGSPQATVEEIKDVLKENAASTKV